MVSRSRFIDNQPQSGGTSAWQWQGSVITGSDNVSFATGWSSCNDTIDGTYNDHFLDISHRKIEFIGRVNGESNPNNPMDNRIFKNYVPQVYRGSPFPGHLTILKPSDAAQATTAKARTNPSRPVVNLPVAIAELKDLPGLVKYLGTELIQRKKTRHNFHNQVGDAYMSGVYGIGPMISDAAKMLDFNSHVERRANELERLYSNRGLKRRITLLNEVMTGPKSFVTIESQVAFLTARYQDVTSMKQWATIRWLPTSLPPSSSSDRKYADVAKGLVLGLRRTSKGFSARNDAWSDLSDIWNLMPWSWLVDWYSNIGDYLDSNRNTIPAQSSRVNVMTTTKTVRTYTRDQDGTPWAQGGSASFSFETKSRTVSGGTTVSASLPFLSANQLSILGALNLQRLRVR